MKLLIFVTSSNGWTSANPIELAVDPNDLSDEEKLELYGRSWAGMFEDDIVMAV